MTPWTAAHQASLSFSLLELVQTHVHWGGDAIQPSHPLSTPSPPAFNLSQHQGLFQWVSSLHQMAKVLEFQLQHQSFQWIFRTDFLYDGLVGSPCSPRDSQESSPVPQFEGINSLVLSLLYVPTLTSICDHWKTIALTKWTFVGKVVSLLYYMLCRFVIAFLSGSKCLLISWLSIIWWIAIKHNKSMNSCMCMWIYKYFKMMCTTVPWKSKLYLCVYLFRSVFCLTFWDSQVEMFCW